MLGIHRGRVIIHGALNGHLEKLGEDNKAAEKGGAGGKGDKMVLICEKSNAMPLKSPGSF